MSVPSAEYPQICGDEAEICLGEDAANFSGFTDDETVPETVEINMTSIICEFRESLIRDIELDEHHSTDIELLRWLKARSMDTKAAEEMFRNSLEWRQKHGIDDILEWTPPPQLVTEFPFQICGFDNDGDQFGVVTWSKWNIASFVESIAIDRGQTHIRYFWHCLEVVKRIMRANSTKDKTIYSGIVIIDMEGLAISQFAGKEIIEIVLEATRQYEANYPGFLKKAIVVNTPQVFSILYQLMRPFLSAATQASVEIYGYYDDWRGALRTLLPVEQLPSRHGGANTTVSPYRPDSNYIVKVPELEVVDESKLISRNVPAGQKLDLDFVVNQVNTELRWAFRTDDYDIGFGVFFVSLEDSAVEIEVADFCRVDSHVLLQRGRIVCREEGKYILRFDNTSSWIRPKTLYYQVTQAEYSE